MRTIVLLIAFVACSLPAASQEKEVFSYRNNILLFNRNYVDTFYVDKNSGFVKPSLPTVEKSITSKTGSKYDVKMYRYMDFENDPGDFHVIDIYYGGKRIFSQKFDLGWDYFYTRETYERSVSKPFELIELTNNRLAIVFTGITITSEPPMITVILLENGTASLVYNKPSFLNKVTRNADSVVFDMQLDNGEIPYEGAQPGDPKARRLTFKNGLIYFQAF